jgi:pectinesterase
VKIISSPILILIISLSIAFGREKADLIVAQDGSGNYSNIQDAIDAVPQDNSGNFIILIRNGVYHEKIFLTRSHITLVGEDRDSTVIIYAELRKNVNIIPMEMRHDWGTAVINIDSSVTDLTLANLTVHNNYGSLYGDHDHQFAIRGGGTRIIIVDCNIIADGGDTLSL